MRTLLEVVGLSVRFDGFKAINNLSFDIGPAELRAVIGPNGAGKTTFMDIVTGKTKPDHGSVLWGEKSVNLVGLDEAEIAQAGIGRKFQKPTVFEDQTVFENLLMSLSSKRDVWSVFTYRRTEADCASVDKLALDIGLGDDLHRVAGELSHGQKQWLEIGMLLVQDSQLLLVDEPAAGMTDSETEQTAKLLQEISDTKSVMVVEHDMEFVKALNCKVTVLHEGTVLAEGTHAEVQSNSSVIEVYLGR